jgi:hypothetical protein
MPKASRRAGWVVGDKDKIAIHPRISKEASDMLLEMSEARGGGVASRNIVIEEAIRLWYEQDPMLARRGRRQKKAPAVAPAEEG